MGSNRVEIDLISSSPSVPRPKQSPYKGAPSHTTSIFDINSDSFDFPDISGSVDFPVPELVKRTKLSHDDEKIPQDPRSAREPVDLSDEENLPIFNRAKPVPGKPRAAPLTVNSHMSDAIEFTSSAPETKRSKKNAAQPVFALSDDLDVELPDIFAPSFSSLPQTEIGSKENSSERTATLLANFNSKAPKCTRRESTDRFLRKNVSAVVSVTNDVVDDIDDILGTSLEKRTTSKPKLKHSETNKESRAAAKAAKELEKEAEKEQKRLDRERKAQEKQRAADLAEVNKSKADKKESVKEMIVDIPSALRTTSIGNQLEAYMEKLEVQYTYYDDEINTSGSEMTSEAVGNVIKWRRKVEGVYNPELDHFQPLPQKRISREKHILVHLTGTEFATLASRRIDPAVAHTSEASMKANLDAHVHAIKLKHEDCTPIYLIEGLSTLVKRNMNAKNRDYQAAARAAGIASSNTDDSIPPAASQKTKKRKANNTVPDVSCFTPELSSALLLHLQLAHSPTLLLHHVSSPSQTAHWITTFTAHLSTRPYRLLRQAFNDANAGFCMDTGQIKTGVDARDTYIRMLQELPRVTSSMAHGIREDGWESMQGLVRGFRKEGRDMLQDVKKAVNRDGGVSERRIGPSVSRRLYKLLFSEDPWELNI